MVINAVFKFRPVELMVDL